MKHRLIIIIALLVASVAARAAGPAACSKLLTGYRGNEGAAETIVTGKALKPYNLEVYQGLTLTDMPGEAARFEAAVAADSRNAADREMTYRAGRLYYAFITLSPEGSKNRYIFYLNQHPAGGDKIILIYMSGKADSDSIKKMLKR